MLVALAFCPSRRRPDNPSSLNPINASSQEIGRMPRGQAMGIQYRQPTEPATRGGEGRASRDAHLSAEGG